MRFKVGQIFEKEGKKLCLIEIIEYSGETYGLFSVEDVKFYYIFYQLIDTGINYNLIPVLDETLNNVLLGIFERKNSND